MTEPRRKSDYYSDDQYFKSLISIAKERINTGAPIWGEKIIRSTDPDCPIHNTLGESKLARKYDDLVRGR